MNCKNCGFPLNGNQTCPSCGTVNEINNTTPEQVVQPNQSVEPLPMEQAAPAVTNTAEVIQNVEPVQPVNPTIENPVANNNVGPTPVTPEIKPIDNSSVASSNYTYQAPKKKNTGLIIILIILGLLLIGAGVFFAIKFLGNKPDTPVVEPTKEETKKEEKTDEEKDAKYAPEQMFIDEMSNKELFDLVHKTLNFTIVDGETLEDLYKSLEISKTGKKPSGISGGIGVDFEFLGVMLGSTKRDYISKVHIACDYKFKPKSSGEASTVYNSVSDSYVSEGRVEMAFYSDKAEEIYNSFKTQYSELYPGVEIKDSKGSGGVYNGDWIQFDLKTPDNRNIFVRLENDSSKDRTMILVGETQLK